MFRVKTRRNNKRTASPPPTLPTSPVLTTSVDISGSADISGVVIPVAINEPAPTSMTRMTNFFEAESVAASTTKPWLRLERGLRMQKLRTFAEAYPGLSAEEKETLSKTLAKANDSKLLNTKQQIVYENGKILNIRGLKIIRDGDPTHSASFKIEIPRQTKKKGSD
jgi:hypothetical protein